MIKKLVKSVLHVIACDNIVKPEELQMEGKKTIAEIFNEEKNNKEKDREKEEEE